MEADVQRVLSHAEDVMRRELGTPEARAANTRRIGRAVGEMGRRVRNGAMTGGVTAAGVAGYALAIEPIGVVGLLLAVPAVLAAGTAALFVPTRRAAAPERLAKLAPAEAIAKAEDWVLRQRTALPSRARPQLDAICAGLGSLGPQLVRAGAGEPRALEAQRLVASHLPRLVDAYVAVPPAHRTAEVEHELIGGLRVVGDELKRLSAELARGQLDAVKVEQRFLESRYGETADGPR